MASTRLQQIVDAHRAAAERDDRSLVSLMEQALATATPRDWKAGIAKPGLSVIAEVKRRSPSMGDLAPDLDPVDLAQNYEAGGASCLSVLTDVEYFGGSVEDLQAARSAVSIPVLRKDFTVDERDVADARIMGADAILLIVAALEEHELRAFSARARELDLAVLWEVHDDRELEVAAECGASILGVNQRNLHTFEIDYHLADRIYERIPAELLSVAESGVRNADDAKRLAQIGYDAVLVGTSLVTSADANASIQAMVGEAAV
jgi:indole-3-glycerol phosphate synthase